VNWYYFLFYRPLNNLFEFSPESTQINNGFKLKYFISGHEIVAIIDFLTILLYISNHEQLYSEGFSHYLTSRQAFDSTIYLCLNVLKIVLTSRLPELNGMVQRRPIRCSDVNIWHVLKPQRLVV